jgi:hypothetical protein
MSSSAALAAALLAIATLGGCGGSDDASSATTAPTSVTDQVEAACRAQAVAFQNRPPRPVANFDPEHPDPEQLPAVGAWFTSSNYIGEAFIDKLEKLSPPEAEKAKLDALIEASRDQIALARIQEDAAARKDVRHNCRAAAA